MKKILWAFLTVSMLAAMITPVLAVNTGMYLNENFTAFVEKNGESDNDKYGNKFSINGIVNKGLTGEAKNIKRAYPVKGYRGKAASDTAVRFATEQAAYPSGADASMGMTVWQSVTGLEEGQVLHFFIQIMNEDANVMKEITPTLTTTNGDKWHRFLQMLPDRQLKIFGTTVEWQAPIGGWNQIDLYLHGQSTQVDCYVNGMQKTISNSDPITGLKQLSIGYTVPKVKDSDEYAKTGMCVDNLKIEVLDAADVTAPQYSTLYGSNFTSVAEGTPADGSAQTDFAMINHVSGGKQIVLNNDTKYMNVKGLSEAAEGTGVMQYNIAKGVYGKEATDESLYVHNDQQYWDATAEAAYNTNGGLTHSTWSRLAKNRNFRIGFSMAAEKEGYFAGKRLNVKYNSVTYDTMLSFEKRGEEINFMGQKIDGLHLQSGKWYRFDIEGTVGSAENNTQNTAKLYINGVCVTPDPVNFYTTSQELTRLDLIFNYTALKTGAQKEIGGVMVNEYCADGFYLDDFCVAMCDGSIPPAGMVMSHSDEMINSAISQETGIIAPVAADYTVEDFLAGVEATAGTVSVCGANGENVTSGLLKDCYVKLGSDFGGEAIFTVSTKAKKMIASDDFEHSFEQNKAPFGWNGSNFDVLRTYESTGKAGKTDADHAMIMEFSDYIAASPIELQKQVENLSGDITFAFDYLHSGDDLQIYLGVAGEAGLKDCLYIAKSIDLYNGKGYESTAKPIPGRWYRLALNFHVTEGTVDLYVNGEKKLSGPLENKEYINRIKFYITSNGASEQNPVNAVIGLDNIEWYYGNYDENTVSLVSVDDYYTVDKANGILVVDEENPLEYLLSGLETDGTLMVYTDRTLSREETEVYRGGNVVAVHAAEGSIIEYYDVITQETADQKEIILTRDAGKASAQISLYSGTQPECILILAVYEQDTLVAIQFADAAGKSGLYTIDCELEAGESQSVLAMAVEDFDSLKPICHCVKK